MIATIEEGVLKKIKVLKHAVGVNYIKRDSMQVNRLTGKTMECFFTENAIDSTHVFGNAQSIYFYTEGEGGQGKNETSADTLNIYFSKNRVSRIFAKGAVKGTYYSF